jgi:hypothetical protein
MCVNDNDDIVDKRKIFVGQVNNVLGYFCNLSSLVRQRLFTSYCMSLFGCELWQLDSCNYDIFCIAWCKAVRRMCSLPPMAHSNLLLLLNDNLLIFDEICKQLMTFISAVFCMTHF